MWTVAIGLATLAPVWDVLSAKLGTVVAGAVQFEMALGPEPGVKPGTVCDSWQTTCRASVAAAVASALLVATYSAAFLAADWIVSQP